MKKKRCNYETKWTHVSRFLKDALLLDKGTEHLMRTDDESPSDENNEKKNRADSASLVVFSMYLFVSVVSLCYGNVLVAAFARVMGTLMALAILSFRSTTSTHPSSDSDGSVTYDGIPAREAATYSSNAPALSGMRHQTALTPISPLHEHTLLSQVFDVPVRAGNR